MQIAEQQHIVTLGLAVLAQIIQSHTNQQEDYNDLAFSQKKSISHNRHPPMFSSF